MLRCPMLEATRSGFLLFIPCIQTAKLIQTDYAAIIRDIRVPEDRGSHSGCPILFQSSETEQADLSNMCSITQTGVLAVP